MSYLLKQYGFPSIENLDDLCNVIHLSKHLLYKMSRSNDYYYTSYLIQKTGTKKVRRIFAPSKNMKAVQAWILRNILEKIPVTENATGFRKGYSVLDNANRHFGNNYFYCFDLDNFFPSIKYGQIYTIFSSLGYNAHICHILTSLCSCHNQLPQGGVTSPLISNIVCTKLDRRLSGYVGKRNITYTRYADDMTFSSLNAFKLKNIRKTVRIIVESEGFKLNNSKTRFLNPNRRRKITGLVMTDNGVRIGKLVKRELRAKIHSLYFVKHTQELKQKKIYHLNGWFSYLRSVDIQTLRQLNIYDSILQQKHQLSPIPELNINF